MTRRFFSPIIFLSLSTVLSLDALAIDWEDGDEIQESLVRCGATFRYLAFEKVPGTQISRQVRSNIDHYSTVSSGYLFLTRDGEDVSQDGLQRILELENDVFAGYQQNPELVQAQARHCEEEILPEIVSHWEDASPLNGASFQTIKAGQKLFIYRALAARENATESQRARD